MTPSNEVEKKNYNYWFLRELIAVPYDCIICAIQPCLQLNKLNVCPAFNTCPHSNANARQKLIPSKSLRVFNIIANLLLFIGFLNDLYHLDGDASTKSLLIILEAMFYVITIWCNFLCTFNNRTKIQELHGLITLILNKSRFFVDKILTTRAATQVYAFLMLVITLLTLEEITSCLNTLVTEELNLNLIIRIIGIEFIVWCNASIGIYILQFLGLYYFLFSQCYKEIQNCLTPACSSQFIIIKERYTFKKQCLVYRLQKLQRLYMCLQKNFKLNEKFIEPGIIITYTVGICLLSLCYCYLAVLMIKSEITGFIQFDYYILIKSMALVVLFVCFCYAGQKVYNLVCSKLSSLLNLIILFLIMF